ncbi:MAG TPA: hypothetical protein DGR97_07680 [Gammaproteobacteria bacterium]|nr:hypothetical protein [Gammaproteobacteria bacterium]
MPMRDIQTVDLSASKDDLAAILKQDGCVIIKDAETHGAIDVILADLDPYLERKACGEGDFVGFYTKRLHSLFTKTQCVGSFLMNDKVLEMMDLTLGPWCESYQLNSNSITAIGPNETPQPLHRDDLMYPMAHPSERNTCTSTFWALTDFTEENGATRIIPGSHLWDDHRIPREDETVPVVMSKGSFCVFVGGVYHGGGRNVTANEWRIAMFAGYSLGWLRQEQNWYLSVPLDVVKAMPEPLARLLGYNIHKPFLGWMQDLQDPWDVINGYEELSSGGTDLYADGAEGPVQGPNVKIV